jgi:crotonobetainyl-CoA:carnitine CoA-transferase CaiB-like acyl-CoA transferase
MVDCSLLGGQIRLMGWTLTTAMWRNRNPVTGQARVTGTPERPGLSASFDDCDGKPFVFQLNGAGKWREAMTALGFYQALESEGFADLRVAVADDGRRAALLERLDGLFAVGPREEWVARLRAADIVAAPINTLLEAADDPDVLANGYVAEIDYPEYGKRLKVHGSPWRFSATPARIGIAPKLGADNGEILEAFGYTPAEIADFHERGVI